MISQLPIDEWYASIGYNIPMLAAVPVDARRPPVYIEGESMRETLGEVTEHERLELRG